jgi:hypothetical protein
MKRLFIVLCLLAVVVTIPLAACGGSSGGAKTTPAASATSTSSAPSNTGTPEATPTPAPDPFAGLQSYRYQMQMSGDGASSVLIKGTIVVPDSIQMDFYLSDTDTPVNSLVIIGSNAWTKNSTTGEWESIDVAEAQGEISGLLPKDFWGGFPMDKIIGVSTDLGEETVNGVQAHHYQITQASPETMAKLAEIFGSSDSETQPTSFDMDLWRADQGGWPAKAAISATYPEGSQVSQASVSWDVTEVNTGLTIQPPA